mmetsp:Transcript_32901/g.60079  ORF Transcript_32901/g.60079 Transcript_32901/m.60079 type:complete len:527 (-) Transcript_32901:148-1728(-)
MVVMRPYAFAIFLLTRDISLGLTLSHSLITNRRIDRFRRLGNSYSSHDFETDTTDAYRVHRIDCLKTWIPEMNADVLNPLVMTDHLHESYFVGDGDAVIQSVVIDTTTATSSPTQPAECFKRAGPRLRNYFKPNEVNAAVVTCGGICPGLNTVVREVVTCLNNEYGVHTVWGIPGGYRGFNFGPGCEADLAGKGHQWLPLTAESVDQIHTLGGTVLGTGRGGHDTTLIVDALEAAGVNQLFVVGGDGTMRGASKIADEAKRRNLRIAVVGIPKTVDNDIPIIDKSFGFETAVEEATKAITSAHVEAESFPNGVGVVQLMGRHSGFIALHATLGSRDVDCVLIPEVDFELEGPGGLFAFLEERLLKQAHVVVVVAEGCARSQLMNQDSQQEVGPWLCEQIQSHFKSHPALDQPVSMKYINPTYMVRSVRSNAADNVYCTTLAHSAVHGAFAGLTNFMVGPVNAHNAYIPLNLIFNRTNVVSVEDEVWSRALFSTGQPDFAASAELEECDVASGTAYGGCTVDLVYSV